MADIKKITLPSGDEYDIKDEAARELVNTKQDALSAAQMAAVNSGITAETLFPTTQKTLTPYNSRCTITAGGYAKIGAVVFLDVALETATAASATGSNIIFTANNSELKPLSGVPVALTIFNTTSRTTATKGILDANGRIQITNCEASQTLRVCGCYLSAAQ